MSDKILQLRRRIYDTLTNIMDPEVNLSIMELDLIDDIKINGSSLDVDLHMSNPFCPVQFCLDITRQVRDGLLKIEDIDHVKMNLTGHFMASIVNDIVNSGHKSQTNQN